jgi:hypothetical protein
MRLAAIPIAATALLAFHAHAQAPNMKEGLWEVTTRMEMPGMPAKPTTMQRCVTKKEVQDAATMPPGGAGPDKACKVTDYKIQGNAATWKMACEGQMAMTGSGTITYSGTAYSGSQTMTMNHGGQTQNMTVHFGGKHLGDCKK